MSGSIFSKIKRKIKKKIDQLSGPRIPELCRKRWEKAARTPGYSGISDSPGDLPLIVSLTSYPPRIGTLSEVIKTLLVQTLKPDMLLLWLGEEEFPGREADLPQDLLDLRAYGLAIRWCRDIKSYKKLIPTLNLYQDAVIVTTDDDLYYHPKMLERLYQSYQKDPNCIHCHRASKMYLEDGAFKALLGGYDVYEHPSYLNKLTGVGGVLYPPHILHPDVLNEELFMKLVPTNDDVWFWLMGVRKGVRCRVVDGAFVTLNFVGDTQKEALGYLNNIGEKLFDKQLTKMLDYYPEINEALHEEWNREVLYGKTAGNEKDRILTDDES